MHCWCQFGENVSNTFQAIVLTMFKDTHKDEQDKTIMPHWITFKHHKQICFVSVLLIVHCTCAVVAIASAIFILDCISCNHISPQLSTLHTASAKGIFVKKTKRKTVTLTFYTCTLRLKHPCSLHTYIYTYTHTHIHKTYVHTYIRELIMRSTVKHSLNQRRGQSLCGGG